MKTIRDILRDADPLDQESHPPAAERERLRRAVVAAASAATTRSPVWFRTPAAALATIALIVVSMMAVGSQIWSRGGTTLQAAIRFEVRLAEDYPSAGLRAAQVAGSDRVVYLHQEIVVANDDIEQTSVVQGDAPSRFGVSVEFTAAGTRKMRDATASHVGRPMAVLIDGDVVTAPVLRSPIGALALISGDYTLDEAERIVHGIGIR